MIIVLGSYDEDSDVKLVDGGIDTETMTPVVLPPENFNRFTKNHCVFDQELQEFVLRESLPKVSA